MLCFNCIHCRWTSYYFQSYSLLSILFRLICTSRISSLDMAHSTNLIIIIDYCCIISQSWGIISCMVNVCNFCQFIHCSHIITNYNMCSSQTDKICITFVIQCVQCWWMCVLMNFCISSGIVQPKCTQKMGVATLTLSHVWNNMMTL